MRSRHHPHIGAPQFGAAHATVGAALQQAKQLDLDGQRDVAHLVQEQRAAVGGLGQTGLGGMGPGERTPFVAEQFALEQGLGQAGAIHHHQGRFSTRTGFVHRPGQQFLAGAGLSHQQHAGFGRPHTRHQFQHLLERRCAADQAMRHGFTLRHAQGLHLLDEPGQFTVTIAQRHEFDVDVGLALRGVMQVQHALGLCGLSRARQGAALAGLVAGHAEVVGDLVAGAPHHRSLGAELPPVGRIRCRDAVVPVKQDVRLRQAFQVGDEFGQHAVHRDLVLSRPA